MNHLSVLLNSSSLLYSTNTPPLLLLIIMSSYFLATKTCAAFLGNFHYQDLFSIMAALLLLSVTQMCAASIKTLPFLVSENLISCSPPACWLLDGREGPHPRHGLQQRHRGLHGPGRGQEGAQLPQTEALSSLAQTRPGEATY